MRVGGIYQFRCRNCGKVFDKYVRIEEVEEVKCRDCDGVSDFRPRKNRSNRTFSDRLYDEGTGFYHEGLGEVVTSEKDLEAKCLEHGFDHNHHKGVYMTAKEENRMMHHRVKCRPKELRPRPKWTGRCADWPVFETYEKGSDEE